MKGEGDRKISDLPKCCLNSSFNSNVTACTLALILILHGNRDVDFGIVFAEVLIGIFVVVLGGVLNGICGSSAYSSRWSLG